MGKAELNIKRCKGCYLCISVCPTGALSPSGELGPKGFGSVKVDKDKCVGCGACFHICPECVIEIIEQVGEQHE